MDKRSKVSVHLPPKRPQQMQRGWPIFRALICRVLYFVMAYYSYLWIYTNYRETLSDIFASVGKGEFATAFDKLRIWLRLYRVPQCEGGYVHDGSYEFKDLECVTPFVSS
ncbi:hypothetical protein TKK_0004165 [Trichogramma kaykai]